MGKHGNEQLYVHFHPKGVNDGKPWVVHTESETFLVGHVEIKGAHALRTTETPPKTPYRHKGDTTGMNVSRFSLSLWGYVELDNDRDLAVIGCHATDDAKSSDAEINFQSAAAEHELRKQAEQQELEILALKQEVSRWRTNFHSKRDEAIRLRKISNNLKRQRDLRAAEVTVLEAKLGDLSKMDRATRANMKELKAKLRQLTEEHANMESELGPSSAKCSPRKSNEPALSATSPAAVESSRAKPNNSPAEALPAVEENSDRLQASKSPTKSESPRPHASPRSFKEETQKDTKPTDEAIASLATTADIVSASPRRNPKHSHQEVSTRTTKHNETSTKRAARGRENVSENQQKHSAEPAPKKAKGRKPKGVILSSDDDLPDLKDISSAYRKHPSELESVDEEKNRRNNKNIPATVRQPHPPKQAPTQQGRRLGLAASLGLPDHSSKTGRGGASRDGIRRIYGETPSPRQERPDGQLDVSEEARLALLRLQEAFGGSSAAAVELESEPSPPTAGPANRPSGRGRQASNQTLTANKTSDAGSDDGNLQTFVPYLGVDVVASSIDSFQGLCLSKDAYGEGRDRVAGLQKSQQQPQKEGSGKPTGSARGPSRSAVKRPENAASDALLSHSGNGGGGHGTAGGVRAYVQGYSSKAAPSMGRTRGKRPNFRQPSRRPLEGLREEISCVSENSYIVPVDQKRLHINKRLDDLREDSVSSLKSSEDPQSTGSERGYDISGYFGGAAMLPRLTARTANVESGVELDYMGALSVR